MSVCVDRRSDGVPILHNHIVEELKIITDTISPKDDVSLVITKAPYNKYPRFKLIYKRGHRDSEVLANIFDSLNRKLDEGLRDSSELDPLMLKTIGYSLDECNDETELSEDEQVPSLYKIEETVKETCGLPPQNSFIEALDNLSIAIEKLKACYNHDSMEGE